MLKTRKKGKPQADIPNYNYRWPLLTVVVVTMLVFTPSLTGDFVNWDDETYIEENRTIQKPDLDNVREMFSTNRTLIGNYHPLTELSFAVNFAIFKLNPSGYIGTNILLHLFNTVLVFLFFYRFSDRNVVIATLISLLFGIHPMHVESVCWISERKDVLYVFFFLSALITYLDFLKAGKKRYYFLTIFLFLLSLLSKAQAVTLPLVLLLIHYWHQNFSFKKILIRLSPFFIMSVIFGMLAIKAQNEALTMVKLGFLDRIIVSSLGLFTYLVKAVLPFKLSALHPYPTALNWPEYYYLLPVFSLAFFWLLFRSYRKNRMIFFGLSFFLLTILPVLQILPVGMSMFAERYTYLPYLGLFFILASGYNSYLNNRFWLKPRHHFAILSGVAIAVLSVIAFDRTKVWKNSETLWLDVIKKYPRNFVAYVNITNHYIFENELDKAIEYADMGIQVVGHNVYFYDNKAYSLIMAHQYREALEVINTAKNFAEPDAQLFVNEGDSYLGLNLAEEAITSYTEALKINPAHAMALTKRANVYLNQLNDPHASIRDLEMALAIDPQLIEALISLAVSYHRLENTSEALLTIERAIALDPENQTLKDLKSMIETN